jgi:hypothetical protein
MSALGQKLTLGRPIGFVRLVPQADMLGISTHQLQERRSCHARTRDEVNFCAFRIVRQVAASIVNCLAVSNLKEYG